DNLGWKDPFGDHKFTLRQQELAAYVNSKLVYTPEVFVSGRELRHWSAANAFDEAIKKITSQPSPADIEIKLSPSARTIPTRSYDLSSNVKLHASLQGAQKYQAYIAIYENKLVSKIAAGENGGVTLHHDYVVRQWIGPFVLKDGAVNMQEKIILDKISPDMKADQFGVVVFVQNAVDGSVLQAVRLHPGV
ncbi:MAG: DUF1223 domain-containing protein, partial [Glaciimonas sp.]|nr:DUF1223 domain-containing protein [Glaciimonas sp.]